MFPLIFHFKENFIGSRNKSNCIINIPFWDSVEVAGIGIGVVVAGTNVVVLFPPHVTLGGSPLKRGNTKGLTILIILSENLYYWTFFTNLRISLQKCHLLHMGHYKLATCCYTQLDKTQFPQRIHHALYTANYPLHYFQS